MRVEQSEELTATHDGRRYYFCSDDCRDFFAEHPRRFIETEGPHLSEVGGDGAGAVTPHVPYGRARGEFEHDIADPTDLNVGDSVSFTRQVTNEDVVKFAEATGDTNALHLDDAFAEKTRFGRRIAHGTLVSGLISAALACLPGLSIYLAQNLEFSRPVDIGATLTARCEIVEELENDRFRLTTRVENDADEIVLHGTATVLMDEVPDV